MKKLRGAFSDWIIAHDGTGRSGRTPYTLECLRCGATLIPSAPIAVSAYVDFAKAFQRAHLDCRPR